MFLRRTLCRRSREQHGTPAQKFTNTMTPLDTSHQMNSKSAMRGCEPEPKRPNHQGPNTKTNSPRLSQSPAKPAPGPAGHSLCLRTSPSNPAPAQVKGLEKTRAHGLARLCWLGAPKQWTSGKGVKEKKVLPTYNGIQFRQMTFQIWKSAFGVQFSRALGGAHLTPKLCSCLLSCLLRGFCKDFICFF